MKKKALIAILPLCVIALALFSLAQLPQDREIEIEIEIEEEPHSDSPEEEEPDSDSPEAEDALLLQAEKLQHPLLLQAKKLQDEDECAEAEVIFRQLIESDSADAEIIALAHLGLGNICLRGQNRIEEAIVEYEKVLKDYPKTGAASWSLTLLADSYRKLGRHDDAKSTYNRTIEEYPGTLAAGWALEDLGEYHQRAGRFQEAISTYNEVIEKYKGKGPEMGARDRLGEIYYRTGEYDKAISEYEKVLSEPEKSSGFPSMESGSLRINLGNSYLHEKQYEAALSEFRKLLDYSKENVEMLCFAGREIGMLSEYSDTYDSPASATFKAECSQLIKVHREKFPKVCEEVLSREPDNSQVNDYLGAFYFDIGRQHRNKREYEEAIPAYRKTVSLSAGSYRAAIAFGSIARCYSELGECDKAIAELKKVIDDYPLVDRKAGAQYRMGMYYREAGRYTEAIEALQQGMETYPDGPTFSHEQSQRVIATCQQKLNGGGG